VAVKLAGSTGVTGALPVVVGGIAVSPPPVVVPEGKLPGAVGAVNGPVAVLGGVVGGGVLDDEAGALVTVNPVVFSRPSTPGGPTRTQYGPAIASGAMLTTAVALVAEWTVNDFVVTYCGGTGALGLEPSKGNPIQNVVLSCVHRVF
jgi:hypothetical protein